MPISQSDVHLGTTSQAEAQLDESKATRINTSRFLITINSNYRTKDPVRLKKATVIFYNRLEVLVKDPRFIERCIDIQMLNDTFENNVMGAIVDTGVEYSSRAGLHAHSTWKIFHTTRIRINLNALRLNLKSEFPEWKQFFVDVRFAKNGDSAVTNYVYKTVRGKDYSIPCEMADHPEFGHKFVLVSNMALSSTIVI
jgi:hypothetical protein